MKLLFHCTSFPKHVTSVCLFLSSAGSKSLLTRRCKTFCSMKLNSTRSPQSHPCLNGFFLKVSIVAVSFMRIAFTIIWACTKLAEEISRQSAPKRFLCFGPPANGNKVTPKIPISPKSKLNGNNVSLICDPEKAKRDANGFFKVFLLSSHDFLISRHPVRKSKFGACAVKRYCSLNLIFNSG